MEPASAARLADLMAADWPSGVPRPVGAWATPGGWVATTWLVRLVDGRDAVVKLTPYPADAEVDGLEALTAAGVPVPRVLGHTGGTLVMERVGGPPDWELLGRAIAGMHRLVGERFGWHRDNHAGRFVQVNDWSEDWPTFFVEQRVRVHLADQSVPAELRLRLERACDGPIQALLPAHPTPSLTHGDLWLGNIVEGRWVVDPEVSFADRELDLAYMQMSEGRPLPGEFWSAYLEMLPVPDGYEGRRRVLELHHRLLNVLHFGDQGLPALHVVLAEKGW